MARVLIIGCGCRGRALARELSTQGHAVRGTTRDAGSRARIAAAGAQAVIADPDRVATLVPSLEHVSVACVLLGSAAGTSEELAALHGTRLEMLLARILDTTVRGIVYELSGSVDPVMLAGGAERVRQACEQSHIPCAWLRADPLAHESWLLAATAAVGGLLSLGGRGEAR